MNRCIFLDDRSRRCARIAEAGDLYCQYHSMHPAAAPAAVAAKGASLDVAVAAKGASLDVAEEGGFEPPGRDDEETVEFPAWHRVLRRTAGAALLALFLIQTYLAVRELLK